VKEDRDASELDELGFEPAVRVTGAERGTDEPRPSRPRRSGLRRKLGAAAVLAFGLVSMGGAYAAFAASSGSSGNSVAGDPEAGRQLFATSCITCHGANLQGVQDRGPSLLGVGAAAAYFQVSTGRMPLARQGADSQRKTAKFDEQQVKDIAAYVEQMGGGPTLPSGDLRDANIAAGGEQFRLNCASCHGTTGRGAPLSAGKTVPSLMDSTDQQIYTAMISGPENMPIFSDNALTPQEKRQIVAYVQILKASKDPGGHGIGRIGPVSEAIVIWVAGIGALMAVILWIGVKSE
jgi:ubiquinol-cytochrome c reductase cytochrome c subunit